jgi:copper chaperone CopZ
VRIAVFSEIIASGDKKAAGSVDTGKIEAAVKRISGVSSASYDPNTHEISVGYSGAYADVKKIKIAVDSAGVSCELLSPAKVIVRPTSQISDHTAALTALKGVAGVLATEKESNDLIAYSDLSAVSLENLIKAVEGAGIKCQIASHEEIKVKYTASGKVEELKDDLNQTKWVLKVDVDSAESCVKVLAVKGRVTRAVIKTVMSKHGFPEAK